MNVAQAKKIKDICLRAPQTTPWDQVWVQQEVLNVVYDKRPQLAPSVQWAKTKEAITQAQKLLTQLEKEQEAEIERTLKPIESRVQYRKQTQTELENELLAQSGIPPQDWNQYRHMVQNQAQAIRKKGEKEWRFS